MSPESKANLQNADIEYVKERPDGKSLLLYHSNMIKICGNERSLKVGFTIVFAAILFFYGMSLSYTNSVIISVERRFGLNTKQIGSIIAATEIGHIVVAVFVAHFLGKGNRPRWIALGSIIMGLSFLLFAAPEIIFPSSNLAEGTPHKLCIPHDGNINSTLLIQTNMTISSTGPCESHSGVTGPVSVLALAHVLIGVGSTTPMILGFPYLDDNIPALDLPVYYGIALFGKLIGPATGYGIGSVCATVYYDFTRPRFGPTDPRWISAWYIGFIVVAIALIVSGLLMALCPTTLTNSNKLQIGPKTSSTGDMTHFQMVDSDSTVRLEQQAYTEAPTVSLFSLDSWKELVTGLQRLFANFAFLCRTSSMFIDGMIIGGFLHFIPKYFAQQFNATQSQAALSGGLPIVFSVSCGIVAGSALTKKFRFLPRHVALSLVIPNLILATGLFIAIGLKCAPTEIYGLAVANQTSAIQKAFDTASCPASRDCGCDLRQFSPVCDPQSGVNFYSPCFAGCSDNGTLNIAEKKRYYRNCQCLAMINRTNGAPFVHPNGTISTKLRDGLCNKNCQTEMNGLTALLVISVFFYGIALPGQVIIQFRVVDVDLKNLCAGVTSLAVAAFGLLPAPIFVGAIVDSTCDLWQTTACGKTGACYLYDTDQFRWKFFLTAGCLKFLTVILDGLVTWKVWNYTLDRYRNSASSPR